MDSQNDMLESMHLIEERLNNKIDVLFKYKKIQITLKIVIFTSLSCLTFVRSGKSHDIYLWMMGIFLSLIALSEFFELEELRFYFKDNKKVLEKNTYNN